MALGFPKKKKINKAAKKPHRFLDVDVEEVSLVTDPAILSAEESEDGVGIPVIKVETERPAPEWTKKVTLREDEDVFSWVSRLVKQARTFMTVKAEDPEAYWFSAVKIMEDFILFADIWANPYLNNSYAYHIDYSYDEDGDFEFEDPKKMILELKEEDVSSDKGTEKNVDKEETDVSKLENKLTPDPEQASGGGNKTSGEDAVPGEGDTKVQDEETKKFFELDAQQLVELLQQTGKSFTLTSGDNGNFTLTAVEVEQPEVPEDETTEGEPTQKDVEPSETSHAADQELVAKVAKLEEENKELRQKAAGSAASDPDVLGARPRPTEKDASEQWGGLFFDHYNNVLPEGERTTGEWVGHLGDLDNLNIG